MAVNNFKGEVIDSVLVCVVQGDSTTTKLSEEESKKIASWLKARTNSNKVEIVDLSE